MNELVRPQHQDVCLYMIINLRRLTVGQYIRYIITSQDAPRPFVCSDKQQEILSIYSLRIGWGVHAKVLNVFNLFSLECMLVWRQYFHFFCPTWRSLYNHLLRVVRCLFYHIILKIKCFFSHMNYSRDSGRPRRPTGNHHSHELHTVFGGRQAMLLF